MAALQLFVLGLCLSSSAAVYTAQQPVTTAWDQRNGKGFAYNTDTSLVPFARTVTGAAPDQITITYQSPTSLVINWVVGDGQSYNSSTTITKPSTAGVQSIVQYSAKGATTELNATGTALTYDQNYNLPTQPGAQYNYTSGIINHVALVNLMPNTEYYYRVGNGQNWSAPSTFTTLQAVNSTFQTYRIGVVADLGVTDNSTITFAHLKESLPDVVILVGDFSYANNLYTNGTITSNYTGPEQTYQPLWDQFFRWWGTLTSRVPYFACAGNHEYEQDINNATFNSYNARFNQTSDLSGSGNSRYYSVDLPGVHFITLSPYDDYNTSSVQYKWLQKDLATFNRTKTPFLVAQWHAPIFNTYVSHYKELECFRLAIEPLLYQYGADLVLHGHVHSYERTNRVFNYQPNPCGPMYITVGDGGNLEQLAVPMADMPGLCPVPSLASSPGSKFQGNCLRYSLQSEYANTTNGGYCPTQQPSWSAYREPSFGHGTLDVSPNQMVWSWHRNQDAEPITSDTFTIVPKDSTCNNLNGPAPSLMSLAQAPAAAMTPAPATTTAAAASG